MSEQVFLHGFLGTSADWKHGGRGVDLPGHGSAIGLDEIAYTFQGAAEYVRSQLPDKCHLIGYSMGGRLALYLALRYPHMFTNLTLIGATPGLQTPRERQRRICQDEELAEDMLRIGLSRFLEGWYGQSMFQSLRLSPELMENRLAQDPKELVKSLRGMGCGRQPSLWSEIEYLRVPTHYIVGSMDLKFMQIGSMMEQLAGGSLRFQMVEGVGHAVHLEKSSSWWKSWLAG